MEPCACVWKWGASTHGLWRFIITFPIPVTILGRVSGIRHFFGQTDPCRRSWQALERMVLWRLSWPRRPQHRGGTWHLPWTGDGWNPTRQNMGDVLGLVYEIGFTTLLFKIGLQTAINGVPPPNSTSFKTNSWIYSAWNLLRLRNWELFSKNGTTTSNWSSTKLALQMNCQGCDILQSCQVSLLNICTCAYPFLNNVGSSATSSATTFDLTQDRAYDAEVE